MASLGCLDGLTFGNKEVLRETKRGLPLFNGSAHNFSEWRSKIENRKRVIEAISDEGRELVTDMIDGLSDDALKIAMDMCNEQLVAPDALNTLIAAMEKHVARKRVG